MQVVRVISICRSARQLLHLQALVCVCPTSECPLVVTDFTSRNQPVCAVTRTHARDNEEAVPLASTLQQNSREDFNKPSLRSREGVIVQRIVNHRARKTNITAHFGNECCRVIGPEAGHHNDARAPPFGTHALHGVQERQGCACTARMEHVRRDGDVNAAVTVCSDSSIKCVVSISSP